LGSVAFSDPGGQLAFAVVVVSEVDRLPVVDDGDRLQVDRDVVRVVGVAVERGEVGAEAPEAAVGADGAEGGRVPLCLRLTGMVDTWVS
jgi:hypothetical protein